MQSFLFCFQKQPSLLLNGEVIWQACDSPLSKELHDETIKTHYVLPCNQLQPKIFIVLLPTYLSAK